nr:hypothetical protein CKG001_10530 [Bdellovibrio sp. CKG001]
MSYADKTTVPVERSQAEIRKTMSKYGATAFSFAETRSIAQVQFEIKGKRVKFDMPMPAHGTAEVENRGRKVLATEKQVEQMIRSKWRSLALAIKAKLECVEAGITTLEQEFLAHIVLPNGQTFGDFAIPQIATAYNEGRMRPLLGMKL